MAVYAYKGIDARGKAVKGSRDADSAKALRGVLRRDGILATEILEQSEAARKAARDIDLGRLFRRISPMDVAVSTRQLAVLLRAGVPLVEALGALIEQLDQPELKAAFTDTRNQVNEGSTLADALKAHPKIFLHALRQHGGCGGSVGHARGGARTARRVLGRADQASKQSSWRPRLSVSHGGGRRPHPLLDDVGRRAEGHARSSKTSTRPCPGTPAC